MAPTCARRGARLGRTRPPPSKTSHCAGSCAGPRASQFLVLGAKARALLAGRFAVSEDDVRALAPAVLRHRVVVNFRAEAEGISSDDCVQSILRETKA